MKRVYFAAAAAAILLLGACGGDDGDVLSAGGSEVELSSDEQAQADRVAAAMLADNDDESDPFSEVTPEQADCVGAHAVEELGLERVTALDWESEDPAFTPEDAPGVAKALVTCVDIAPVFASAFSEDGTLTPEQGDCIADNFTDDDLESLLTFTLADPDGTPTPEVAGPLADAVVTCMNFGEVLVEQFAASGGTISPESAQCLADALPDDLLRSMVLSGMTDVEAPDDEAAFERAIVGATADCLTDEELSSLGGLGG
jgi:hypothetical protein